MTTIAASDGNRYHVNGTVCLASEDECAEQEQAKRWPEHEQAQRRLHVLNGWPAHGGNPCRCAPVGLRERAS